MNEKDEYVIFNLEELRIDKIIKKDNNFNPKTSLYLLIDVKTDNIYRLID